MPQSAPALAHGQSEGFFLATRTAKALLGPTKGPLLGVGIRSCLAGLVPWVGPAGGAVLDFGRLGAEQYFGPQPRANLCGVRLGHERIPMPRVGLWMGTRSTLVIRVAKKNPSLWPCASAGADCGMGPPGSGRAQSGVGG